MYSAVKSTFLTNNYTMAMFHFTWNVLYATDTALQNTFLISGLLRVLFHTVKRQQTLAPPPEHPHLNPHWPVERSSSINMPPYSTGCPKHLQPEICLLLFALCVLYVLAYTAHLLNRYPMLVCILCSTILCDSVPKLLKTSGFNSTEPTPRKSSKYKV
jgi:hypothetical protein